MIQKVHSKTLLPGGDFSLDKAERVATRGH